MISGSKAAGWWEDAVVYEVYPRSFQDSDGDGIGDLRGIESRLPYLEWLGVDAIWLAPIYPSPLDDYGYDVADHAAVAPEYGNLSDLDSLIAAAHERGIRVLLDLVASHTSIEHPWFRERPDYYVWADGPEPPNNWIASFGGSAWSRDPETGRLYLHSFFPEQPDLDWGNPEVRRAMGDVVRFWIARGVDGFRIDAVDRLAKDLELRSEPRASVPFALPLHPEAMALDPIYSRNAAEIAVALAALREAAGGAPLIGEVYLPAPLLGPYLEHLDAVFAFDLLHADWDPEALGRAVERSREAGAVAWVTSNHDFPRVASRWGAANARAAAVLLLTLGGIAFVYQGEEIGMADGPGADPPLDRYGRDAFRGPMQWSGDRDVGFTAGEPWLPLADPEALNVESQRADPGSILHLFRALIRMRRELDGKPERVSAADGVLAFRRGRHLVAINATDEVQPVPGAGDPLLGSAAGVTELAGADRMLAPHAAVVLLSS